VVARFNNPETLMSDTTGNLYVGDANAIRMVSTAGQTITVSPQPGASGLALSNAGILYFSEFPQNTIQAIATDGSISVLAGSQFPGYMDGTGTAAIFKGPHGIAADAAGNLFVADTGNAAIRKITPAGAVTTIAGMPGNPAGMDGIGGAAGFTSPFAIAIDGNGTLFVTDGNAIRRITADGTVTTLAGSQDGRIAGRHRLRCSIQRARWDCDRTRGGRVRIRQREQHHPQDLSNRRRDHAHWRSWSSRRKARPLTECSERTRDLNLGKDRIQIASTEVCSPRSRIRM
jgi:DNA-binding beta-propeller fold protein YncE